MANDGGHLVLTLAEANAMRSTDPEAVRFIRPYIGSKELINGTRKYCLWIDDEDLDAAAAIAPIADRLHRVGQSRSGGGQQARDYAHRPHRFVFAPHQEGAAIAVPRVSSENREFLPVDILQSSVISERCFALYGADVWNLAVIASRLHWVWIGTVCVRMRTDFSYSNTLGWNTFPLPALTEQNKVDLTQCAEEILLARETHYPATIAELYDPDTMPPNLRAAHERNDEVLERIYIGRRFRNDTERLEKLFAMYTQMTAAEKKVGTARRSRA